MAKTYLSIVNELLVEINEPELTGVSSAVGIQKQVSNCVNRAYFDIVDAVDNCGFIPKNEENLNFMNDNFISINVMYLFKFIF